MKQVIELIDEKIDFLNQQNGAGVLMGLAGWFDESKVNTVIDSNKIVINELTDLRMKILELML
ncbi:hypothetical protein [Pseudolactococcus laudensis]|uniref:hypothetical protein n=1 Tax=Pseudolactococcus laudensis TaxID=1494461 RepID=UPI002FC98BC1